MKLAREMNECFFFAPAQEVILNTVGFVLLLLTGGLLLKAANGVIVFCLGKFDELPKGKMRASAAFQLIAAAVFLADAVFAFLKVRKSG